MEIDGFIAAQLASWPEAAAGYAALDGLEVKTVDVSGHEMRVQFNPARIRSTGAKVDAASVAARPCFLCEANRPARQTGIDWRGYTVLLNPFPIFPKHLTIAAKKHVPQSLVGRVDDMVALARELDGFTVFFNGAGCGASAPDHMHFQAVPSGCLTMPGICGRAVLEGDGIAGEFARRFPDDRMVNAYCSVVGGVPRMIVIPRRRHRPGCYGEVTVSPAAVDLGGVVICPRREDFERMDSELLSRILAEVTYPPEPTVSVGIMNAPEVNLRVSGSTIEVDDVTIGVDFHWQRREAQRFAGRVRVVPSGGGLQVINDVPAEEYLRSVISSEMRATSSIELLKAHAVISRGWLLAQLHSMRGRVCRGEPVADAGREAGEVVKWYDRDDHTLFDVCADDHCQRYQGVTRVSTAAVDEAVAATRGQVLTVGGMICDTRFSKCCGGVMERFENCWQPVRHSYLTARRDAPDEAALPDLTTESGARRWIMESPADCFCNTADREALRQVLNDYDCETPDFFRWTVRYSQQELSEIVAARSPERLGSVTALIPLTRGASGRITRLKIEGTLGSVIVGKELEIRKRLSRSHLYSSAFVVDRDGSDFVIHGAGWGHGVGLCQIGAAMMARRGYGYREILSHYFPGAELTAIYY